jgi:hypothetical protein
VGDIISKRDVELSLFNVVLNTDKSFNRIEPRIKLFDLFNFNKSQKLRDELTLFAKDLLMCGKHRKVCVT